MPMRVEVVCRNFWGIGHMKGVSGDARVGSGTTKVKRGVCGWDVVQGGMGSCMGGQEMGD